jgi:hypothetical protein
MSLWRRAGGFAGVTVAVVVAALLRVAQLFLIAWLVPEKSNVATRLLLWDGGWFLNVAEEGYPAGYTYDDDGVMVGNGFAFFPLFPFLVRLAALLGFPYPAASLLVAGLAGMAASLLIYLLGTALFSRRAGYLFLVLVCAQPMAVVLVMGYTEPLFLALATGTLLAAHQRSWWLAGLAAIGAALTRPVGMAVAFALVIAVLLAWREMSKRDRVVASCLAAVSLVAGPLYLAWVGWRVGEWDAWFKVQTAGWGSTFDFGSSVIDFAVDTLTGRPGLPDTVTLWLLVGTIVLAWVAIADRTWVPLVVFGLVALLLVVGQAGYWHSKPRLLVPVLLLAAAPVARHLAKVPARLAVPLTGIWAAFGLWFGAYMITIWPFTI